MSYYINKTDGTAIQVLDGTTDTTSTSLALIGKLSSVYGEKQNENIVRLLENFSYNISPSNPITGQLWFDTDTNNIKVYTTANVWVTVGSVIQGNISLTGNLLVGNDKFRIQNLSGNAIVSNFTSNANINFVVNVAGVQTTSLIVNGATGLVTVAANATANLGVTTKLYVDSTTNAVASNASNNLAAANVIIHANLAARIADTNAANVEIGNLRSNITAANSAIITANTALKNYVDSQVNALYGNAVVQADDISNLNAIKAAIASPTFTGEPRAPTALPGENSTILATTAFVYASNIGLKNNLQVQIDATNNNLTNNYALKNSPAFTGTPTAPTPSASDNSTKLATTAFVQGKVLQGPKGDPGDTGPAGATGPRGVQGGDLAGTIKLWAGSTIPDSTWMFCNGAAISRTSYSTLFSRIGTTYGSGDGVNTFNLPNFTNRFAVGAGNLYNLGATGGTKDALVISHTHDVNDPGHGHILSTITRSQFDFTGGNRGYGQDTPSGVGENVTINSNFTGISIDNAGESGTDKNLPPYLAANWIIKVTDDAIFSGTLQAGANISITTVGNVSTISGVRGETGPAGSPGAAGAGMPPGSIIHVCMNTPPTGFLKADGSAVSRTTFSDLFDAIGTTFGSGDGASTFNLPDLRGEFVRSWDDGRGVDSGRQFGSGQIGSLNVFDPNYASFNTPNIIGRTNYLGGTTGTVDPTFVAQAGYDFVARNQYPNVLMTWVSSNTPIELGTQGFSYGATRPRNVALLACIKF